MVILKQPETATNLIPYEVTGNKIEFDEELSIRLDRKERDCAVHLDICYDYFGGLIVGTDGIPSGAKSYVAQIDIPPRAYEEVENEGEEEGTHLEPVPFDIDRCTLTLWELEV